MKVKLLSYTPNSLDVVFESARTCYNAGHAIDMWLDVDTIPVDKKLKLVKEVLSSGHGSTSEHVSFTFAIDGIDRATSHQLVRHRFCQFSQQSQRYVKFKDGIFEYNIPDSIKNTEKEDKFIKLMNEISDTYKELIDFGIKAEDARAILPNACSTNLILSCNLRELIHVSGLRLCTRAQKPIRDLFKEIRKEVISAEPWLGELLVPKCEHLGICTEFKCCGRKPTLEQIQNKGE